MEFPDHLTARLLRLSEHQWRSLRTKVRWAYTKYNYNAVGILSEYMRYLPEDAKVWLDYAKSVNVSRRNERLADRRRENGRRQVERVATIGIDRRDDLRLIGPQHHIAPVAG